MADINTKRLFITIKEEIDLHGPIDTIIKRLCHKRDEIRDKGYTEILLAFEPQPYTYDNDGYDVISYKRPETDEEMVERIKFEKQEKLREEDEERKRVNKIIDSLSQERGRINNKIKRLKKDFINAEK